MLLTQQFILLAEYNQRMNQRQFAAAAKLSETELNKDNGAFFKSVLDTLNHIFIGDIIWLKRFAAHPACQYALEPITRFNQPTSLDAILSSDLSELLEQRKKVDQIIVDWLHELDPNIMGDCIRYQNIKGIWFNKPLVSLVNHLFQHQTHHRGQVTTLLSQYGIDFGETDLIEMIAECDPKTNQ